MVHEELKVRITTDTEHVTKHIKAIALALTAAAQQVKAIEKRIGLINEALADIEKRTPKRMPK